jgi:uncharacterized membrane protein YGL010W
MRTLESWLSEYSESHQNKSNQKLHKICVPAIFFSILGMLWTASWGPVNAAMIVTVLILPFYIRLGMKALVLIVPQLLVTFGILYFWSLNSSGQFIFNTCLGIFVIAWIGQFIGHKIEGKKPSFFKDLQFLLIGPIWVWKH